MVEAQLAAWLDDQAVQAAGNSLGGTNVTENDDQLQYAAGAYPTRASHNPYAIALDGRPTVGDEYARKSVALGIKGLAACSWWFYVKKSQAGDVVSYTDTADPNRVWMIQFENGGLRLRVYFWTAAGTLVWGETGDIFTSSTMIYGFHIEYNGLGATNSDRLRIYWAGQPGNSWNQATLSFAGTIPSQMRNEDAAISFGRPNDGSTGFVGEIGEFAIVGGVLTAGELTDWRANGIDPQSAKIISFWKWKGDYSTDPPNAPTNLRSEWGEQNSPLRVKLIWDDNANNESSFEIEYKIGSGGVWTSLPDAPAFPNVGTFAHFDDFGGAGYTVGVTYFFRVRARNSFGPSAWSNESNWTAVTKNPPTAQPANCAIAQISDSAVRWTWTEVNTNHTETHVLYRLNGFGPWIIADPPPDGQFNVANGVLLKDSGAIFRPGDRVETALYHANNDGKGPICLIGEITLTASSPPSPAPSGLIASAGADPSSEVDLSWSNPATNASTNRVEFRRVPFTGWGTWDSLPWHATVDTVRNLTAGVTYEFRIVAVNSAGETPSAVVSRTTSSVSAPALPTLGLVAVSEGGTLYEFTVTNNDSRTVDIQVQERYAGQGSGQWVDVTQDLSYVVAGYSSLPVGGMPGGQGGTVRRKIYGHNGSQMCFRIRSIISGIASAWTGESCG